VWEKSTQQYVEASIGQYSMESVSWTENSAAFLLLITYTRMRIKLEAVLT